MPARFSLRRRPSAGPPEEAGQADTARLSTPVPEGLGGLGPPGAGDASGNIYAAPYGALGAGAEGYEDEPGYDEGGYYPAVYGTGVPGGLDGDLDDDDESWLAPDTRRRVKLAIPTLLLGLLVVAAGAFWGGAVVDKHYGDHNTTSAAGVASALRSAGLGGLRGTGGEGFAGTGGGFGGFERATPAAEGTLSAVSGDDLTVTPTSGGAKVKVVMDASTVVTRSGKGNAGALSVGDTVTVLGTKATNGTVAATSVTASAPGVSAGGTSGAGGFAGLGGSGATGARTGSGSGSSLVHNGGFSGDGSGVSAG